jgi:hypothetical protein
MKLYFVFLLVFLGITSFNVSSQVVSTPQKGDTELFGKSPFSGTTSTIKMDGDVDPIPKVEKCDSGPGERCNTFASNCLAKGGHYNGDNSSGTCCSGTDHPDNNASSPCN